MEHSTSVTDTVAHPRVSAKANLRYLWVGLWLIGLGVFWLVWNLDLLRWSWVERYGFVVIGLFFVAKAIFLRTYHFAVGISFLTIGLFHLYLDYAEVASMRALWPIYFLLIGSGFMVNFLVNTNRWPSLTLSLVSLMTGGVLLSRSYFLMPATSLELLRTYWPLTLVASGTILIATAWFKKRRMGTDDGVER